MGSIPRRLKSLLLSGKRVTKKYMKYDIVIKKRESTLKQLEHVSRICFHLNKIHEQEDMDKRVLRRIIKSLDSSIISDFDTGLHPDFEDPNFLEEHYKNMTHRVVLDLENEVRRLRYEYIKLRAKEAKLSGPIHLYEYSKEGLWFRLRKILLWSAVVFLVLLSALALHAQLAYSLNHFFNFDFYFVLKKILRHYVLLVLQLLLLCYMSVAVLYAVCRIEIKHWYLLERKSSTISSLLFYIL